MELAEEVSIGTKFSIFSLLLLLFKKMIGFKLDMTNQIDNMWYINTI